MLKKSYTLRYALVAMAIVGLTSCDDDNNVIEDTPLRDKIDYASITATTPYAKLFVDKAGNSTVDLSSGNNRYKMFQMLNSAQSSAVSGNKQIDAAALKNMFSNTGNPFGDSVKLNTSGLQLRDKVASSWATADAEAVRARVEALFTELETTSKSVTETGEKGKAGKIGNYLVNAQGIELVQIVQKSLIGALQLDYISNVLLTKGLEADNRSLVPGKPYTQLEQNWDEAYGFLTLNPVYLIGSTDDKRGTTEFGLGAYTWEYNKPAYPKMHEAFLRGRAAIVNNDKAELKVQVDFIRAAFEKALAKAAVGYLKKFIDGTTDAARVHAIGEGLGFIYSLRFANVNGADAKFSDEILAALILSPNGFWDLTPAKVTAASDAITAKFKL